MYPGTIVGGSGNSDGAIKDAQGRSVAYFVPNKRFFQVQLSGPPVGPIVGPSAFKKDTDYLINVRWSSDEKARWQTFKHGLSDSTKCPTSTDHSTGLSSKKVKLDSTQQNPLYTLEEKRWLKVHYGDEFHFLQAYGLSIYKDEDREEGRVIMRGFMAEESSQGKELVDALLGSDDEGDSIPDEDTSGGDEDEDEDEDENDLDGHMADYHFDAESLEWIKQYYGNSMNFMFSYGLKFYDDDDCKEAIAIVHAMMSNDD
jgi:hypothetical protein